MKVTEETVRARPQAMPPVCGNCGHPPVAHPPPNNACQMCGCDGYTAGWADTDRCLCGCSRNLHDGPEGACTGTVPNLFAKDASITCWCQQFRTPGLHPQRMRR